jgi:hypothetical protein
VSYDLTMSYRGPQTEAQTVFIKCLISLQLAWTPMDHGSKRCTSQGCELEFEAGVRCLPDSLVKAEGVAHCTSQGSLLEFEAAQNACRLTVEGRGRLTA